MKMPLTSSMVVEINSQGNLFTGYGALLPLVQWLISFLISCFEKRHFSYLLFQQLSLELIDNYTSGSAPFPVYIFPCY